MTALLDFLVLLMPQISRLRGLRGIYLFDEVPPLLGRVVSNQSLPPAQPRQSSMLELLAPRLLSIYVMSFTNLMPCEKVGLYCMSTINGDS